MHDPWTSELRPVAITLRRGEHSILSTRIPVRQLVRRQLAAHLLTAASAGSANRDRTRARVPRRINHAPKCSSVSRTLVGQAGTMRPGHVSTHLVLERSSIQLLSDGLSQGRYRPPVKLGPVDLIACQGPLSAEHLA